jgi:LPS sulfotransferase NodH
VSGAAAQAQRSYFICCLPRSGSWLLADALRTTGRAGRPEEFYWDAFRPSYLKRWGNPRLDSFAGFLDLTFTHGTTPNGLFGAKLHWGELEQLGEALAALGPRDAPLHELLRSHFPEPSFVHLRRTDVVRQAISWWRALRSSSWYQVAGEPRTAETTATPDWRDVFALEQQLRDGERRWRAFLDELDAPVLHVFYEDLVDDYGGVVSSVLEFLGVTVDEPLAPPRLLRQRDELTEDWTLAYVEARRALLSGGT